MRLILTIEYEYCRVYLHMLALQAVITRCVNNSPIQKHAQPYHPASSGKAPTQRSSKSAGGVIPAEMIAKFLDKDAQYIQELVDGCHRVLEVVISGLLPGGFLKHCPVRTYFRIISVTSILLKVRHNSLL
jgi:hypothetical protein